MKTRKPRKPSPPRMDWLARALGRAGILPPDEIEDAIRAGRVAVDGRVARQPLTPWKPGQRVRLDGHEVLLAVPELVLMFHKPRGTVTSHVDQEKRPTVFDVLLPTLPPELRHVRWHAIGRLDVDTTGLLLFTNDERVLAHVTSPASLLEKVYVASVQGRPTPERVLRLVEGVTLDDGIARAVAATVRDDGNVELRITEGRHHQVKRMLGAIGLPVTALHREAIGGVRLDVATGEQRLLSPEEIRDGLRWVSAGPSAVR